MLGCGSSLSVLGSDVPGLVGSSLSELPVAGGSSESLVPSSAAYAVIITFVKFSVLSVNPQVTDNASNAIITFLAFIVKYDFVNNT